MYTVRKSIVPFSILFFIIAPTFASESYTEIESGYKDGFYIKTLDDKFSLKVGSRVNMGYTYGLIEGGENLSSFDIQHAKFYMGGNAYGPHIQYYIQAAAANNTRTVGLGPISESTNQGFILEDYYVRIQYEGIDLKFGQFKVPYSRQWMIYSGNIEFIQRASSTQAFMFGRDRGFTLSRYNDTFNTTVGVFNGGGTIQTPNPYQLQTGQNVSNDAVGSGLLYVARMSYFPFGSVGYSEGDVEQTQGERVEFAGGFAFDQDRNYDLNLDNIAEEANVDTLSASGEVTLKSEGASLQGEYFWRRHLPGIAADFTSMGFYVQPGYFFVPRKIEGAVRFSWLDPNTGLGSDKILEGAASLNYYISEDHRVKTKLQYMFLRQDFAFGQTNDHFLDLSFQVTL